MRLAELSLKFGGSLGNFYDYDLEDKFGHHFGTMIGYYLLLLAFVCSEMHRDVSPLHIDRLAVESTYDS